MSHPTFDLPDRVAERVEAPLLEAASELELELDLDVIAPDQLAASRARKIFTRAAKEVHLPLTRQVTALDAVTDQLGEPLAVHATLRDRPGFAGPSVRWRGRGRVVTVAPVAAGAP
jgi:hypothetical protein